MPSAGVYFENDTLKLEFTKIVKIRMHSHSGMFKPRYTHDGDIIIEGYPHVRIHSSRDTLKDGYLLQ